MINAHNNKEGSQRQLAKRFSVILKMFKVYSEDIVTVEHLALEEDTTVQALLAEALNKLFEEYGKKLIA